MADLTSNTLYNKSGTQSPLANLSNLQKTLQQKTQQTTADTYKSALMTHYSPETLSKVFGTTPKTPAAETGGFPVGTPIAPPQEGVKYESLPEGYNQFVPSNAGDPWSTPSDQARLRDWPSYMGGGQYVSDPTQPSALIKSQRTIMEPTVNPGIKQKILGKLSPLDYQVDHIVPLWIGGADTLQNLQVFDNITHAKKTAVQAVPLTLLAKGKITLNEAKIMALTWQDKDAKGLPAPNNSGYLPLDVAEKYAAKWKLGNRESFGSIFKEEMGKFGKGWLPDPIREFAKGLVGGGTAGIVPGTEASAETDTIGKVSNIVGNIAGTLTGIGLAGKALGKLGLLGRSAKGIKQAQGLTQDVMKTTGLVTDLGSLTPKAVSGRVFQEKLGKMASSALVLSAWGQAGLAGRELTGQEKFELGNHIKQAAIDTAYGGILGAAGQNVKGYANVGLWSTIIPLMEGQEIVPALQNGILMTALHGMGYKRGTMDPKLRIGNEEAYKMSASTLNRYVGDVIPTIKKGQGVPGTVSLDIPTIENLRATYQQQFPNDPRLNKPITNNEEAINFIDQIARKKLSSMVAKSGGTISQEEFKKELTRITVAKNQIYNQTLDPTVRVQKELQDLYSMGEKLRPQIKGEQFRGVTNSTDLLKDIPFKLPEQTFENTKGQKFLTGNVPTTGYGDKIDVVSKQTINDVYNNPQNYSDKVFIVKDPETTGFMNILATEGQNVGNPNDALRVFVKTVDGQVKPVGYIPREESFDVKKNPLNKTYFEITKRLRHTIETATTPEELKIALNKDKAKIAIDDVIAQSLFESKAKLMTDEELYAVLKPQNAFQKYSSELNNSALSTEMDRNGIKVLVVNKDKVLPIGSAEPRANPDNPYLSLNLNEQDWLRSIALKDKSIVKVEPAIAPLTPILTPDMPPTAKIVEVSKTIETPKKQATLPLKTPKTNVISGLVERSKLTAQEAEPYIIKERKIAKLNEDAKNRYLTETEKDNMYKWGKEIRTFLESKNLIKPAPKFVNFKGVVPKKGYTPRSEYQTFEEKRATDSMLPEESEQIFVLEKAQALAEKMGTKDIKPKERERLQNQIIEMADKMSVKSPGTEQRILNLLGGERNVQLKLNDAKLAKDYGLQLKPDGFLPSGKQSFSEEFKQNHPTLKNQSPEDYWGSFLTKELEANRAYKTYHSEQFAKGLTQMEMTPGVFDTWSKTISKGLKKIVVDPQEPWLKKLMDGKAEKSFTLNALTDPNGWYMKNKLFNGKNPQGHFKSQPIERIIAEVEGASPQKIKEIDTKTLADEETAAMARSERQRSGGEGEVAPQTDILAEGYEPGDLKGMNIADITQMEKVQDLTNFELRFPSLIYEGLTGKTPPPEAVVNDGIKFLKDLMANYNSKLKKTGKIQRFKIDDEGTYKWNNETRKLERVSGGWNSLREQMMGKKKADGQGGPIGDLWGKVKNTLTNTQTYTRPEPTIIKQMPATMATPTPPPTTYNVRGLKINDQDISEAAHVLYGEISNRKPEKQQFEVRNIINTAVNRAQNNPKGFGATLTEVLQKPYQYQGYAPQGMTIKGGKTVESQYQKVKAGKIDEAGQAKLKLIQEALNELKTGKFADTTGGSMFYVHASDGTMWLGKTLKEAKQNANAHEKAMNAQRTRWGTSIGLPVQELARR